MSAAAGWYADPSGVPGQLRWWDGARWTDHVTPDPSAVPATTAPGRGDAEAAESAAATSTQPPPPTGAPDAGPASGGHTAGAWGSGGAARPAWQVDTPVPTGGSSVRTWLIVAAVVGVILIGLVAVLIVGGLRAGSVSFTEFDDGVFESGSWDGPTVDGGTLAVGDTITDEVPFDGAYEVRVDIREAGSYVIDARADESDFDGMLEVVGPDGDILAENDDRDERDVRRAGGDSLDPYLELDLGPGEHRVVVRGFAGDGGAFSLTIDRS